MTSITREDENEIYSLVLKGHRQSDVAKKFNITQGYVSQIFKKITQRNDEQLAVSTAQDFIAEYNMVKDYLTIKQFELEELLQATDDPKLKSKIIMDQVSISQTMLYHVSQKKFIQSVQEDTYALQAFMHTLPDQPKLEDGI